MHLHVCMSACICVCMKFGNMEANKDCVCLQLKKNQNALYTFQRISKRGKG